VTSTVLGPASDLWDDELDHDRFQLDDEADALLVGAVDMHTHPGPSPYPRRVSILDAAVDAASMGFHAIVCKSHHQSMQTDILALRSAGLADVGVEVIGGVALNRTVGGLNAYAVELALRLGGRVVWFPTISSASHITHHEHNHDSGFPVSGIELRDNEPISVLDDTGRVNAETHDVLDVIAAESAVLNCGHLSADEIDVLIPAALSAGVARIVVSHPDFLIEADAERVASWCRQGIYVEHCMPQVNRRVPGEQVLDRIQAYYDAVGPSRTIFSSDLGQAGNCLPVTAFRRMVRGMLDLGVPEPDIRTLVGGNARQLLQR
jgi:hypothetical protein